MEPTKVITQDANLTEAQTVRIVWGLVLLAGVFFRLFALGSAPLSSNEAVEALAALKNAAGAGHSSSGLVLSANVFLFWLLGSKDSIARLAPAIAGVLLPASAWLFERYLGRKGALAAAGLLAICPSAVFLSRTVSPVMPGVTAAMIGLGALVKYRDSGNDRWLLISGIAFGLGIGAGAAFLSLALLILLAVFSSRSAELKSDLGKLFSLKPLSAIAISLLLGSTCFLFYPAALGATADGLAGWLAGFSINTAVMSHPFILLAVYEPLVVILGMVGLVWSLREKAAGGKFLAFWLLFGIVLALFRPGQPDAPFIMLVPLTLLGGYAVGKLAAEIQKAAEIRDYKTAFISSLAALAILCVHIFLCLGQYSRFIIGLEDTSIEHAKTSLLMAGVSTIMIIGIVSLVWTYSRKVALSAFFTALIVFLTFFEMGKAWELGHTNQSDPREYWVEGNGSSTGAQLLADTLQTVSQRTTGFRMDIPLTVQVDDPLLHWLLRDMTDVTWVEELEPTIISDAVITTAEEENPVLGDSYMGIDFALQNEAQVGDQQPGRLLRWLLLRDGANLVGVDRVVLWIRQDIALTAQE